ncbi:hypothetical protein Poli38472_013598 [Pythium oligandrum]|uniref:Uncharacterized protein n=1 Tax=Pythium oligandrum TaxID=41045 RepID=A0A8K1CDG3_PYTOL|nr:hypothetical protein Poli38472_013598 [Pythium oligandrum]|eukprot:TMW61135.1 hypothetical protein Poli38472_013598 [Pythium oligandrum]
MGLAARGSVHAPIVAFASTGINVPFGARMAPLGEASRTQAVVGMLMLFVALGITSAPLFDSTIDTETLTDNSGFLVTKNASYAKAYFMGTGFLAALVTQFKTNKTAGDWFPQPTDKKFLNFPYLDPNVLGLTTGACAILDTSASNPVECIIMTGHQGSVSAYGLCRNNTEFVAVQYLSGLVTPADIGGLVSSGTWVESTRESILVKLLKPPACVGGKKVEIYSNITALGIMSGPFTHADQGPTNQWFDVMHLPIHVRSRMKYLVSKVDNRQGLTLPFKKRQSFDNIIVQNTYGATLADKLEIAQPFTGSKYAFVTLYRIAGADITLPRLQFTFAVAAQVLMLLGFFLMVAIRNGPTNTYHFVHQILRLPTFCIIALQLLYVLYYQIFEISYLRTNAALVDIYRKKIIYVAGVGFILLHQLDVRAAVSLWPKMANNDSYYFVRIVWMLASLGVFLWSLTIKDMAHYTVATSSTCSLGASECNKTELLLFQHYVSIGVLVAHPLAYSIIQIFQWRLNKDEYIPLDTRKSDQMTSFELRGCGGLLRDYYYYNTLICGPRVDGNGKLLHEMRHLTCSKAVRDEGFVMLGGCNTLIRAKDLCIVMLMKVMGVRMASTINLSIVVASIQEQRLATMRRVSYRSLWSISRHWDGRISYPHIG